MKSGWAIKKLGEVCESQIARLKSLNIKKIKYIDISSIDRTAKRVLGTTEYSVHEAPGRAQQVVYPDDLLVSTVRPNLNAVALVPRDIDGTLIASTGFSVLRAKDVVSSRWLYYYSQTNKFIDPLVADSEKAAYPSVTDTRVRELDVPVPPLAEQKRIVAKIDAAFEKIDKLKANAERNLANAKELFQSALDEAMRPKKGWMEKRLGEVCAKIGSGATPRGGRSSYCATGVSLIRSMNVYDHAFEYKDLAHISNDQANELDNVTIENQDVLINITGASVARCCVVPNDVLPARVNQHVAILRIGNRTVLESEFLCYSLITPANKHLLLGIGEAGSTRQALTKSDLSNFVIQIPPIKLQREIIQKVSELSYRVAALQQHYTRQIADCAEMRQSVLRTAFEGRL